MVCLGSDKPAADLCRVSVSITHQGLCLYSFVTCNGTLGDPLQVFWYVLDLPRPAFLAKTSCADGCLLLDCIASLRSVLVSCMDIPTLAVFTLACSTASH